MAQRKPTKAELEYARLRSTAAGLPSTTTKKQLQGTVKKAAVIAVTVAGPGKAIKVASKVAKAAKAVKAAKAAKAAEKTTKNLPKGPTVKNPPKPPMGQKSPKSSGSKAIEDMWVRDAKLKAQRAADLAEDRKRLAQMARDRDLYKPKSITKPKPTPGSGRKPFN